MAAMLGLIYLRFGRPAVWFRDEWAVFRMGGDLRLSVDRFVKDQRGHVAEATTLGDYLRHLYRDTVANQHLLIANAKWPNNTFRFEREGGTGSVATTSPRR